MILCKHTKEVNILAFRISLRMKSSWSVFIVSIQNLFGVVSIQNLFDVISIQDLFGVVSIHDLFENICYLLVWSNHVEMVVNVNDGIVLGVADHVDSCSCSF